MKAPQQKLDVEDLIARLPLNHKASLLSGGDFWHTAAIPDFGIPAVRVSDGPNGVRGQRFFQSTPASCFPCATGLAASFDVALALEVGEALGDECRAKGAAVHLGPTTNTHRSPLGGRGFESFSEDPLLNGLMGAGYINGVQSKGVVSCLKHYAGNDQEHERLSVDAVISQRALREVYLEPFRLCMKLAKPGSMMTALNRINGTHVSESKFFLQDVLREEWGFDGFVMSDWTGTYSTKEAIDAGCDLEMPGPTEMRGAAVIRYVNGRKLKMKSIDAAVRNMLNLVNKAIDSGIPFDKEEEMIDTPEMRALLRKAASGATVLLKNDKQVLPLKAGPKTIAVIGANARVPQPSGGGSASLTSTYTVSPLDAIAEAAKEIGAEVSYATGATAFKFLPLLDLLLKDGQWDFYLDNSGSQPFLKDVTAALPSSDHTCRAPTTFAMIGDSIPDNIMAGTPLVRLSGTFTPDFTGKWAFSLVTMGLGTVWLDDKLVCDNTEKFHKAGEAFFGMGSEEVHAEIELVSGKAYKLEVRQWKAPAFSVGAPPVIKAAVRVGAFPIQSPAIARDEAVALAKKSDLAILVVGTNADWETEGTDRRSITIPGENDELVKAVLAVNPNTIVVTQSGTPLAMPWIDSAPTVLHAFLGGNELGNGIADVLFGKTNPSGKLPLTFPKKLEDNPSFHSFGITSETPDKCLYSEGVYVGYKHYDRAQIEPLFPFGFGLSYTTFEISALSVSTVSESNEFTVTATVKNTGSVDGAEAVQVYVAPPVEGRITSPLKELQAFEKVFLKAGESKTLEISVGKEAFSYWDEKADSWVAPAGSYEVLVGNSSVSVASAGAAELKKTFKWRGL